MERFDLVVIGAGPGGYVAAVRAAQLGKKVAVVEAKAVGGTCLNVGCIPSKTFLKHSEWVQTLQEANHFGIENSITKIDITKLVKRKNSVVKSLQGGIKHLFGKYKIPLYSGLAAVSADKTVRIGNEQIRGEKILLACGSVPFVPPIKGLPEVPYVTTDDFFDLDKLPQQLIIIGGGVIGVELAFAMAPLGVQTTIVEVADDVLLTEDPEAREIVKQHLAKLGITLKVKAKIAGVMDKALQVDGQALPFDKLLVATGRKADLNLAASLKLKLSDNGKFIHVNADYQTSVPGIYAIGDAIGGWMLAHAASQEGIIAVERMFKGSQVDLNQNWVPRGVYSFPEIGSIGLSEAQAKAQYGDQVVVKKQPFAANGKAISANETAGFVKLITEKTYGEILGAVIVGAHATELIHTVGAVMQAEGTVDDLAQQVFAHPTISEVIGETAKSVLFKAIHE
ncbi:dihydrolipoyl dehydrogenase [Snodgrassella sp. CFCC 13594]|uniref:dihydrolipoyl dehydrogenase n=1 Tax=Snodgrassella sp. CFCC 13594 TaxID=1775559 RepID=UPI00083568BB|nr:dihydrolipoyl dehydrogenase [Snodgrassella sp. CFCC 13594]